VKHSRRPTFRLPVEPDDLVRHALAAYYRTVGDATAPIGDPDPVRWSSPDYFLETFFDYFELRVRGQAADEGHEVEADLARLSRWESSPLSRDTHIREIDPNLWALMVTKNPALLGGVP
jgi:hypothetical protein